MTIDRYSITGRARDLPDEIERIANAVIGAAIEVHKEMGPGHLESHYEKALCAELTLRGIPFGCQVPVRVLYKGQTVGEGRADLIVGDCGLVELKAIDTFAPIHTAQTISYLKTTGLKLALLINFNVQFLKDGIKRVILS